MTTLYIAGPMRARRDFNFPAFLTAEEQLTEAGFAVINPARRDIGLGFRYLGTTGNEDLTALGFNLRTSLAWDVEQVALHADGVATLWGWELSKGATAEVALAKALGLPVFHVGTWLIDREDGVA